MKTRALPGLRSRGDFSAGSALLESALRAGRHGWTADLFPGWLLAAVDGMGHGEPLESNDIGGPGGRVEQGDRAFTPEPTAGLAGVYEEDSGAGFNQGAVGMAVDNDVAFR
jgi:hypothetical protein